MKLITEDVQIKFAPQDQEAAIAIAMLNVIRREDGNGITNALSVIDALAEMVANGHLTVPNGDTPRANIAVAEEETLLTDMQMSTLAWLAEHDGYGGVSARDLADDKDINQPAAYERLRTLEKRGHARRVAPRRWRPISE